MTSSGDEIMTLLGAAEKDVLIVAPFIKAEPLSRLLGRISTNVEKTIVTRWRCADVLAGVSDLEVFEVAAKHQAKLLLCRDLHAKLYVADDSCLVGSANVTSVALGWRSPANVELMVPVARADSHVAAFEEDLLRRSKPASKDQHDALIELIRRMKDTDRKTEFHDGELGVMVLPAAWVPTVRNPEDLYSAYSGEEDTSQGLPRDLGEELVKLDVVEGLSRPAFYAWVAEAISQTPLVRGVKEMIGSEDEVTEEGLGRILDQSGLREVGVDAGELLEVLARWLSEFLGERYLTRMDTKKLIQR